MASERFNIYFQDEKVIKILKNTLNKSRYVETAVQFYLNEKDTIPKLIETISAISKKNN